MRTYQLGVVIRFYVFFLKLVSGNAVRYCDSNGVWSGTDVLSCMSAEFTTILEQVMVVILVVVLLLSIKAKLFSLI